MWLLEHIIALIQSEGVNISQLRIIRNLFPIYLSSRSTFTVVCLLNSVSLYSTENPRSRRPTKSPTEYHYASKTTEIFLPVNQRVFPLSCARKRV